MNTITSSNVVGVYCLYRGKMGAGGTSAGIGIQMSVRNRWCESGQEAISYYMGPQHSAHECHVSCQHLFKHLQWVLRKWEGAGRAFAQQDFRKATGYLIGCQDV